MVEMKCADVLEDQKGKLFGYDVCVSDGKTAPGTCQLGCAFNGQFYKEDPEAIVKIQEKDLVCTNGYWCPLGYKYDINKEACIPVTESCFEPSKCPIDTPTEEKKDLKWFINNKCVVPSTNQDDNKACCFTKFGTTKYYQYNVLPDKEEISFY
ncbi:hypothetical protein HYY69_00055 [Candidatus Woesearchaeota archaeon]|nr:hypothetical protein [Candidatus Woesearchaeota archaeon]